MTNATGKRIDLPLRPDLVVVSGNGATIVIAGGNRWVDYDVANDTLGSVRTVEREIVDIDLSSDRQFIAVADGSPRVAIYRRVDGELTVHLRRDDAPDYLRSDAQQTVAFDDTGEKLLSIGRKQRLYVSDIASGRWDHIMFVKHQGSTGAVYSPDGTHVALFGAPNPRELSGQLTLFQVARGLRPRWTRRHDGDRSVTVASFSPSGRRVASCGAGDGVRVWDVATGDLIRHLPPTEQPLLGCHFVREDGLVEASATQIRWRGFDGQMPTTSVDNRGEPWTGFWCAADGTIAATTREENAINVWKLDQ